MFTRQHKMGLRGAKYPPPQYIEIVDPTQYVQVSYEPPQGVMAPTFFCPFLDLGNGIVNTQEVLAGVSATFTRASTAWTRLSSGLWVSVAGGSPRSFYDTGNAYRGVLIESQRVNACLWARDMTDVSWVKVTMTATKDQAGIDGVANSCTRLTATGALSTILQTIVEAAARQIYSAHVKRITGTGTIEMTVNGGAAWTDITSQINSSGFTLVQVPEAVALANPIVGFRITTSGDEIAVDMNQKENGGGGGDSASTPIPTTTVAVTRNTDLLTYPLTVIDNAKGWVYNESHMLQSPGDNRTTLGSSGAANLSWAFSTQLRARISDGTTTLQTNNSGTYPNHTLVGAWGDGTMEIGLDNVAPVSAAFDGTMPYATAVRIGGTSSSVQHINGAVKNVAICKGRRISAAQMLLLSTRGLRAFA